MFTQSDYNCLLHVLAHYWDSADLFCSRDHFRERYMQYARRVYTRDSLVSSLPPHRLLFMTATIKSAYTKLERCRISLICVSRSRSRRSSRLIDQVILRLCRDRVDARMWLYSIWSWLSQCWIINQNIFSWRLTLCFETAREMRTSIL